MKKRWATYLAALAMSLGLNSAFAQAPPPPPGPLPAPAPMVEEAPKASVAPGAPGAAPAPIPSVSVPGPAVIIPGAGAPGTVIPGGACNDGCQPQRGCTFSVTGGIYYLRPYFESSPAYGIVTPLAGAPGTTAAAQTNLRYKSDAAPMGSISMSTASGVGLRFNYLSVSSDAAASTTIPAGSTLVFPFAAAGPAGVITRSDLAVNVYDLELTYHWGNANGWNLLAFGGVRYATITQNMGSALNDGTGANLAILTGQSSFSGAGPTIGLEAHKQCGCTCFGIYGSVRGSLLYGQTDQSSTLADTVAGTTALVNTQKNDLVPIGEAELGVEAGKNWGRWRVFCQFGVMGQAWFGGGNGIQGATTTASSDGNSNFGFLGGVARLGITF